LSRDRRRSRRRTYPCGLPGESRHPICCRCAPDRGTSHAPTRDCGVARICVERRTCGRSRASALLQGIYGVARICVEHKTRGNELAREDLRHHLWERGLSRDRRRSRRKPEPCDLPGESRHPILLPLRARSRASHAPTRDCGGVKLWERGLSRDRRRSRRRTWPCGLPGEPSHPILLPLRARSRASALLQGIHGIARFCVQRRFVEASLLAKADSQSSLTGCP